MRLNPFLSYPVAVVTCLLLFLTVPSWADDATLKGITTLAVSVDVSEELQRAGLSQSQLQIDAELRLRQSGLRVVPVSASVPWLQVVFESNGMPERSLYVFGVRAGLSQGVSLIRDPLITSSAITWSVGGVGAVGAQRVPELRSQVADVIDRFINEHLKQNPKQ